MPTTTDEKGKTEYSCLKKDFLLIVARKMLRFLHNPPSFRPGNSINFRYQNRENRQVWHIWLSPALWKQRQGICEFKASLAYIGPI